MGEKHKQPTTTWREIDQSIRESGLRRCGPRVWARMADYCRRAALLPDWWLDPATPPHERALAMVLRAETALRMLHGAEVRQLQYVPPTLPPDNPVEPLQRGRELQGPNAYRGQTGTTNGGIGGYHPTLQNDQERSEAERRFERPVFGVAAFSTVEGIGGVPELAWYFGGSVFELGIGCNLEAQLLSSSKGTHSCSAPSGPNAHQTDAATLQKTVRAALRKLSPGQQTVLELAYEDRCIETKLVSDHGHGIAALMRRARDAKARFVESPDGEAVKAVTEAMQTLCRVRKRPSHKWEPLGEREARRLLDEAHDAYQAARGMKDKPRKRSRNRKPHEPAQLFSVPVGSGKRKIWEAA